MEDNKPLGWVKADKEILEHAIKAEGGNAPAEQEEAGIIILPPLMDDMERNAYPADYVAYCRQREKKREKLRKAGIAVPEAPDLPEELMEQIEEANRELQRQAEEANRLMEEDIRGIV